MTDLKHQQQFYTGISSELGDIPLKYICPISKQIMLNPVVEINTGEIYDMQSVLTQTDQLLDVHFCPLNDLKNAIDQFLNSQDRAKKIEQHVEDRSQDENQKGLEVQMYTKNSNNSRWLSAFVNCESITKKTKLQNSETSKHLSELKEVDKVSKESSALSLSKFEEFKKEFQNIRFWDTSEEIQTKIKRFVKASKNLSEQFNHYFLLYNKKVQYERALQKLKEKEAQLESARDELKKAHADIDMETSFVNEANFLSKQYLQPKKVQEKELKNLFQNDEAVDISVHFDSKDETKLINVKGQVFIKNFHATNAGNGLKCLGIILQDCNSSIIFEDCEFKNVGIFVSGLGQNQKCQSISFNNVIVSDAPETGIAIHYSKKVFVNNSKVNSAVDGVLYRCINECILQGVEVKSCSKSGVCSEKSITEMKNCSISNCLNYGVYILDGFTTGQNIEFSENKPGNTKGKFEAF